MAFEAAPEVTARRLSEALWAAERGDPAAWQLLDEDALYRLRTDASPLAALVPVALLRLAQQLVRHPRASVRLDTIRLLALVQHVGPSAARAALHSLKGDLSRGVQRAAQSLLERLGPAPPAQGSSGTSRLPEAPSGTLRLPGASGASRLPRP